MRSIKEHQTAHAAYMTERIQSTIDSIATGPFSQPSEEEYVTLSDKYSFSDLRHIRVSVANRALIVTEPTGEILTVNLGEFVAELVARNDDSLRRLTRALNQRAAGEPLCSGTGIEG